LQKLLALPTLSELLRLKHQLQLLLMQKLFASNSGSQKELMNTLSKKPASNQNKMLWKLPKWLAEKLKK